MLFILGLLCSAGTPGHNTTHPIQHQLGCCRTLPKTIHHSRPNLAESARRMLGLSRKGLLGHSIFSTRIALLGRYAHRTQSRIDSPLPSASAQPWLENGGVPALRHTIPQQVPEERAIQEVLSLSFRSSGLISLSSQILFQDDSFRCGIDAARRNAEEPKRSRIWSVAPSSPACRCRSF
jgi:hypothetical protein